MEGLVPFQRGRTEKKEPDKKFGSNLKIHGDKRPGDLEKFIRERWPVDFHSGKDFFGHFISHLDTLETKGLESHCCYNTRKSMEIMFECPSKHFTAAFPIYIYFAGSVLRNRNKTFNFEQKMVLEILRKILVELQSMLMESPKLAAITFQTYSTIGKVTMKKFGELCLTCWRFANENLSIYKTEIFLLVGISLIVMSGLEGEDDGFFTKHLFEHTKKNSIIWSEKQMEGLCSGLRFQSFLGRSTLQPTHMYQILTSVLPGCELEHLRTIVENLPIPLNKGWKTSFFSSFLTPMSDEYANKQDSSEVCIVENLHWRNVMLEVYNLMVAAERFMIDNECHEDLDTVSVKWLTLILLTIKVGEIRPSHVKDMTFLFDDTRFVKSCKLQVYNVFLSKIQSKYASIDPQTFFPLVRVMERCKKIHISVFVDYLMNFDSSYPLNDYASILLEIQERDEDNVLVVAKDLFKIACNLYSGENGVGPLMCYHHLLSIKLDKLLEIPDAYEVLLKFLKELIEQTSIPKIVKELHTLMGIPTRTAPDRFQSLVCKVLLESLSGYGKLFNNQTILEARKLFEESGVNCIESSPGFVFICGIMYLVCLNVKKKYRIHEWREIIKDESVHFLVGAVKPIALTYADCQSPEVQECISFFQIIQETLKALGREIMEKRVTLFVANVLEVKANQEKIRKISNEVGVPDTLNYLSEMLTDFKNIDESLKKMLLVHYSKGCEEIIINTMINILEKYNLSLEPELLERIKAVYDIGVIKKQISVRTPVQLNIMADRNFTILNFANLHDEVSTFLGPLKVNVGTLLLFNSINSKFIDLLMDENYFQASAQNSTTLSNAICKTIVSVQIAIVDGSLCLKNMNLTIEDTKEMECLCDVVKRNIGKGGIYYGYEGLTALRSMKQFEELINVLSKLFAMFGLQKCISSSSFGVLYEYCQRLQQPEIIPLREAVEMRNAFHKILPQKYKMCDEWLQLLAEIEQSASYVQFCKQMGFIGEIGKRSFLVKYNFITQEICDLTEQSAIDALWMAYNIIYLFIDEEINFESFCEQIQLLGDLKKKVGQMKALQCHSLQTLKECFTRQESETKESISNKLSDIFAQYSVVYEVNGNVDMQIVRRSKGEFIPWDLKDIFEFNGKIQLLKSELEEDEEELYHKIKTFDEVFRVSCEARTLLQRLKEIGHHHYQKWSTSIYTFPFNVSHSVPVDTMRKELDNWERETFEKRMKYPVLSMFSNFKVLVLHQMIKNNSCSGLVNHLISCLIFADETDPQSVTMRTTVEGMNLYKYISENLFDTVGSFLVDFLNIFRAESQRFQTLPKSPTQTIFRLYTVRNPNNLNVYATALRLLDYRPLSFQVLQCSCLTTKENIILFFSQMKYKHSYPHIMIGVNKLSSNLQEVIIKECLILQDHEKSKNVQFDVSFVESGPSLLQTMPWCSQESIDVVVSHEVKTKNVECHLVYGSAGNGKTHYIQQHMKEDTETLTVPVNEDFQQMLPNFISQLAASKGGDLQLYVNITLPFTKNYSLNDAEAEFTEKTCDLVNWFFSSLLVLGYIEDPKSSTSFSLNQVKTIEVFLEVPVTVADSTPEQQLSEFNKQFPVFKFIGTELKVPLVDDTYVCETQEEELVCQYLKAKKDDKLNTLHRSNWFWKALNWEGEGISFKNYEKLTKVECSELLTGIMPRQIKEKKVYQRLFVRYLSSRCTFLEGSVYLRFYEGKRSQEGEGGWFWRYFSKNPLSLKQDGDYCDPKKLRSLLLELMSKEVKEICVPLKVTGYSPPHLQLIYVHDEENFTFIHNGDDDISEKENKIIRTFKFHVPTRSQLRLQKDLKSYLYNALQIPKEKKDDVLEEVGYVLTLDYLQKMLSVHERLKCGMPVIISGETGVGKTFLFETLSKLYTEMHIESFKKWRKDFLKKYLQNCTSPADTNKLSQNQTKAAHAYILSDKATSLRYTSLLEESVTFLPDKYNHAETKSFISQLIFGKIRKLFFVLKVHAGLKPSNVRDFLMPIVDRTNDKQLSYEEQCKVMVFFDELNTSSCLGFFKEIIVDHCMDGKKLPSNLFVVAACNPMRGNSVAINNKVITDADSESWFTGSYLVHPLMPSFKLLIWDFGALNDSQEEDYIYSKLSIMDAKLSDDIDKEILKDKIALSQRLVRMYTEEYLLECEKSKIKLGSKNFRSEAKLASSSSVSQRDIQRVLKFYVWFKDSFELLREFNYAEGWTNSDRDISIRCLYLSLALVYYFRLNKFYREKFSNALSDGRYSFNAILESELKWLMQNLEIPPGIADTQALRENLYAMLICTVNCIPLIITGPPGTSKTLSFKILQASSLQCLLFRSKIFSAITPHIYQCSKHSTPKDIDDVFEKARNMKKKIAESEQTGISVVFLDEAGLPDDNLQVLKVLHYHLDNPDVSFIALTNRVLDAAKSNRAVCLFQVNTTVEDINKLAEANVFLKRQFIHEDIKSQLAKISNLYFNEMLRTEFNSVFGLRDIMHLFSFIRRNLKESFIEPEILVKGIQRNFSGVENFSILARRFLVELGYSEASLELKYPSAVSTLRASILDRPDSLSFENEVRYKLIIDHTEDESVIPYLFKFGILQRGDTKVFCGSALPRDKSMQKSIHLTRIRNSVTQGNKIVLSQFSEIHESLYDLFNQRFTCIKDSDGVKKYYARIAIGSKFSNCLVNPTFQCIVILKKSELAHTPAPFLNRFEKFHLSHNSFLEELLTYENPCLQLLLTAMQKVHELFQDLPSPGVFGHEKNTLLSLTMTHIATPYQTDLASLTLLATPSGEPLRDVLMDYIEYMDGMLQNYDNELLGIFEDVNYSREMVIPQESCVVTKLFIEEAFSTLEKKSGNTPLTVAHEVHLVLALILQYFVVCLVKGMMQLTPPEVFLQIKEKIPRYYTHVYLNQQTHFCLQDLVSALPSSVCKSKANKSLCYCRYTSHDIPEAYFAFDASDFNKTEWMKVKKVLPDIEDGSAVCTLGIHSDTQGEFIVKKLNHFLEVDDYDLLVLHSSAKIIPKETINYVRIVIDELEAEKNVHKKFIFLILFPSELFFDHFYPSYFVDGWNHYYIDAVAPTYSNVSLNLKTCFNYSLGDSDHCVTDLFNELYFIEVPIVCASVVSSPLYDTKYGDLAALCSLLSMDGELSIGKILFKTFCNEWSPSKMEHLLHQAANSSLTQNCKISMTDAVHMLVKFNFHDFMRYMLSFLTRHGALTALLDPSRCTIFLQFVQNQIEHLKLPTTSAQMKLDSAVFQSTSFSQSLFPFFHQVYNAIEAFIRVVERKRLTESTPDKIEKWFLELKEDKDFLGKALLQLDDTLLLWEHYLLDLLCLFNRDITKASDLFLHFNEQASIHCSSENFVQKLIWLHFSFSNTPRNVLSVLNFASELKGDEIITKPFSGLEAVAFLRNGTATAENIIGTFFNVLLSLSQQHLGDVDRQKKVVLLKYYKLFTQDSMTSLLDVPLSPKFIARRDAILTYFEVSFVDPQRATHLINLFCEQESRSGEQEEFGAPYFLDRVVSVMTNKSELEELLYHGKEDSICHPSRNAVKNLLENLLQCLWTRSQNSRLSDWLYSLLKHVDALDLMLSPCRTNDKLFTACFMYQLFVIATSKTQLKTEYDRNTVLPYCPFYYMCLKPRVDSSTYKNSLFLSLCFLKKLQTHQNFNFKQCSELIAEYQETLQCSSYIDRVEMQVVMQQLLKSIAKSIVEKSALIVKELNEVLKKAHFQQQNGLMLFYHIWKQCHSFTKLKRLVVPEYSASREISLLEDVCKKFNAEEKHFERRQLIDLQTIFKYDHSKAKDAVQLSADLSRLLKDIQDTTKAVPTQLLQLTQKRLRTGNNWQKHLFTSCLLYSFYVNFYYEKEKLPEFVPALDFKLRFSLPPQRLKICYLFVDGGKTNSKQFDDDLQKSFASLNLSDDEKDMWQSVAVLIGAIVGCDDRSSHLWYHLFEQDSIKFVPGATTSRILDDEDSYYEEITEMEDNGFFHTQESYEYVTRGTMSLPCLYFTQWANFACLCVHFLVYSTSSQHKSFYENLSHARSECWRGLKRSWNILLKRLNLTMEERLSLIESCFSNFLQVDEFGQLEDQRSLDKYEKFWNEKIFLPAWKLLISQRKEAQNHVTQSFPESIQSQIIKLEINYPVFGDKDSFLTFVLSSTGYSESHLPHYVLNHFLLMRPLLDAIARILPVIIDFYQWVHFELSDKYTRKEVHEISLHHVLSALQENDDFTSSIHVKFEQIQKICVFTKEYKKVLFTDESIAAISKDTLLSELIESNGALYVYIERMVRIHNDFLDDAKRERSGLKTDPRKAVPFTAEPIQSVYHLDDMMELICQHCCVQQSCENTSAIDDPSLMECVVPQIYDLKGIQKAVYVKYISNMKYLEPPSTIIVPWKFKNKEESVTDIFIEHSVNLDEIEDEIGAAYNVQPSKQYIKNLEVKCHSMSYFSLQQVTVGLRIAISYLSKALKDKTIDYRRRNQFGKSTLPVFLKFYTESDMEDAVLIKHVLYIDLQKLDFSQSITLQKLEMRNVVEALRVFVSWLQNGMYEFSSFPFTVKEDIKVNNMSLLIKKACETGKILKLYESIKTFRQVLSKCDSIVRDLTSQDKNLLVLPLQDYLPKPLQDSHCEIFNCFPSVTVGNFVKLSLVIRHWEIEVSKMFFKDTDVIEEASLRWIDKIAANSIETGLNIHVEELDLPVKEKKELKNLTTLEIIDFMRELNIDEEFIEVVEESGVDGQEIWDKRDKDKRLINVLGMRNDPLAFLQFKVFIMRQYASQPFSQLAKACPPAKVAEFCRGYPELRGAVRSVKKYQIDGEMMLELSENDAMMKKFSSSPQKAKAIIQDKLLSFVDNN